MSTTVLHVLVIEDSEDDTLLMVREVQRNGYDVQWQRVQTAPEFRTALANGSFDIILADYTLPQFSAPAALTILRESGMDIPFLVVSGTIGEDTAVALVKSGANDYVMKKNMRRLGQVVERELREMASRRRRAEIEHALRDSEERYRTLFESMSIGVVYQDHDGTITSANPAAQRILGLTLDKMQGRTSLDLPWKTIHEDGSPFPCEDHPAMVALRTGQEVHDTIIGISNAQDKECHWLRVNAVPQFRPGEQSPHQVYAMLEDITASRRTAAENEAIQAKLVQSQKMEAIGELASGVAHDFNNLLTGILGNVALMRGALAPGDQLLEYLNAMELSARRAADLTRGLLTFGRSAVVMPVPMDPNAAVENALLIVRQSLPATIDIIRDYAPDPWTILMDQSQVTQIILNLVVNARDAMNGKGTLTIHVQNMTVDETYVQSHVFARPGDFVHVSIHNTGPVIPDEIMRHLFEPFHTTKPAGTGLGLSIVYGAVQQAEGWITATSDAQAGTIFDIFLPRCFEEPCAPAAPGTPAAPDAPVNSVCSGTVLIVEDEPVISTVVQTWLTRSGCLALTAKDGASALAAMREYPGTVDLVLLDMTMPGMTTREIVRALRALTPKVPILLTSGFASGDEITSLLDSGSVQGFLPKPYELHDLLD
ncbi:MAG: response regulator, partial [Candidatus Cryosericum sp.]